MIILVILGFLVALAGLVGCVLPVIPGPSIGFLALIILSWAKDWDAFSWIFLAVMGGLTILVTILDYVVPALGARKYGASKLGVWGSVVGMLTGLLFFPPWGMFVGAFVGALAGELVTGREGSRALRIGWGVFVGNMAGTGIKLALCVVMLFFYIKEMF
ncbi:MAG: DUF456 domain-containing protein [Thermodesulfobacteriota bacterium]|nr:DUF456 domain-containing protein [Thermodesulfobacteriota bacterium]